MVLHGFCLAGYWIIHMAVENLMGLQDVILRDGDDVKIFMDDAQHITVPRNFLLVAILRRGLLFHQLPDTRICRYDAFNSVGCLCTLDLSDFNQFLK